MASTLLNPSLIAARAKCGHRSSRARSSTTTVRASAVACATGPPPRLVWTSSSIDSTGTVDATVTNRSRRIKVIADGIRVGDRRPRELEDEFEDGLDRLLAHHELGHARDAVDDRVLLVVVGQHDSSAPPVRRGRSKSLARRCRL